VGSTGIEKELVDCVDSFTFSMGNAKARSMGQRSLGLTINVGRLEKLPIPLARAMGMPVAATLPGHGIDRPWHFSRYPVKCSCNKQGSSMKRLQRTRPVNNSSIEGPNFTARIGRLFSLFRSIIAKPARALLLPGLVTAGGVGTMFLFSLANINFILPEGGSVANSQQGDGSQNNATHGQGSQIIGRDQYNLNLGDNHKSTSDNHKKERSNSFSRSQQGSSSNEALPRRSVNKPDPPDRQSESSSERQRATPPLPSDTNFQPLPLPVRPGDLSGEIILSKINDSMNVCLFIANSGSSSGKLPAGAYPVFHAWLTGSAIDVPMNLSKDNSCKGGYTLSRDAPVTSRGGTMLIHDATGMMLGWVPVGRFAVKQGAGCKDVGLVEASVVQWSVSGAREKASSVVQYGVPINGDYGWVCRG